MPRTLRSQSKKRSCTVAAKTKTENEGKVTGGKKGQAKAVVICQSPKSKGLTAIKKPKTPVKKKGLVKKAELKSCVALNNTPDSVQHNLDVACSVKRSLPFQESLELQSEVNPDSHVGGTAVPLSELNVTCVEKTEYHSSDESTSHLENEGSQIEEDEISTSKERHVQCDENNRKCNEHGLPNSVEKIIKSSKSNINVPVKQNNTVQDQICSQSVEKGKKLGLPEGKHESNDLLLGENSIQITTKSKNRLIEENTTQIQVVKENSNQLNKESKTLLEDKDLISKENIGQLTIESDGQSIEENYIKIHEVKEKCTQINEESNHLSSVKNGPTEESDYLSTGENDTQISKENNQLSEHKNYFLVGDKRCTVKNDTQLERVKENIKQEKEDTDQPLKENTLQLLGGDCKELTDKNKCQKSLEENMNECSRRFRSEAENNSQLKEGDGNILDANVSLPLKENDFLPRENYNEAGVKNTQIEDDNENLCSEGNDEVKTTNKENVESTDESISEIIEEIISFHTEKGRETKNVNSELNNIQSSEQIHCIISPLKTFVDHTIDYNEGQTTQETIPTEPGCKNSAATDQKIKTVSSCKTVIPGTVSVEELGTNVKKRDKRRRKRKFRIRVNNESIKHLDNQKYTRTTQLKLEDCVLDNVNLKEESCNVLSSSDSVIKPPSPIQQTCPPLYSTENIDPEWAERLPPPPGCLPVNLSDEPFKVEYDVTQLPPAVRFYVILKGVTEREIHEFSGARVVYVGTSCMNKNPHFFIRGRTVRSMNMAISLIVALIKEGFELLPAEERTKAVDTGTVLESNKLAEKCTEGRTVDKPVKEEVQPKHFEMEYEINDFPLSVRTHIVLKGIMENRVESASGAKVKTVGSYVVPQIKKYSTQKPLCVFIEGTSEYSISLAIKTLEELKAEAFQLGKSCIVRKVHVRLGDAPQAFDLNNRLLGPDGANLLYIENETGADVSLRGRRSGFIEFTTNKESEDPLHIRVEHKKEDIVGKAQSLAFNLVQTLKNNFKEFSNYQSQKLSYVPTSSTVPGTQQYVDPPPNIVYQSVSVQSAKVVYESPPVLAKVPTPYSVPTTPVSSPAPLLIPVDIPPPIVPPPLRPPPPRPQLPQKRPQELGKEPTFQTGQTPSKIPMVASSSSQNVKHPQKKIQFTIIKSTKKTVLPFTSVQTMTKVSSMVTSNPAQPVHTIPHHARQAVGDQPIRYPDQSSKRSVLQAVGDQPIRYSDQSSKRVRKTRFDVIDETVNKEKNSKIVKSETVNHNQTLSTKSQQTTQTKANNQLSQVVELLASALKVYVSSLPDGPEATQLAKVQLLLKRVIPSQLDGRSTDEQKSQLLIVLQLLEKSMSNTSGGCQHQSPLLQTMQILKKLLQTDVSKSTNPQPYNPQAEQKSSQLFQITELLQKALQTYINNLSDSRQKSYLTPVLRVMQQMTAKINTLALGEQKDQLMTILDLLEEALQNQSGGDVQQKLQLLQVMQALRKVLQNNGTSKTQVPANTSSATTANPEKLFQQTPPSSVNVSGDQPSELLQLLKLMITAMQTHINRIGVGAQKSQLLQITQLLEHTVTTQGKNLETEEQKTQLLMILQLLETALKSQSSSGQQSPELLQIVQLIKTTLQTKDSPVIAESRSSQLMQVMDLIQKTLETHASSMKVGQQKIQLFQVIQLLQQALASQQRVAVSPEQEKQLIYLIQLVQQILQIQVFPQSSGPHPLQIVQLMQLIQQTLNTAASPPISSQPQPFSVPPPPNQFNQIAQQINTSVQSHVGMNFPAHQLMQSQTLYTPSTYQHQPGFVEQLVNSLQIQSNALTSMQLGQTVTEFNSNPKSQIMLQMQGLQNHFNLNIPPPSRPLPDQNRIQQLSTLMEQMSSMFQPT